MNLKQDKNIKNDKIEILAPAGNYEAFRAAISAGADAVYLGLNEFNARRGADNFTLDNIKDLCDFAHLRNVNVYLTFNITLYEKEMKQAIDTCLAAATAGIDAFIVQDLGACQIINQYIKPKFKKIRLHISTQMNIHNKSGVRFCSILGADRITFARELSLDEINILTSYANELGIETEVFAHGALCICYSGQCLMSSMIGGRSANRGTCAQACRLNYELVQGKWKQGKTRNFPDEKRGKFLLSPKDLCSADVLPQLISANVSSLKIEGRMKSPDYVFSVVSVYKNLVGRAKVFNNANLDSSCNLDNASTSEDSGNQKFSFKTKDFSPTDNEMTTLSQVFSRGFSPAYLKSIRDNGMMSYKRPNNRGVAVGRVKNIHNSKCLIATKEKINIGDVLEIWTKKGRSTATINKQFQLKDNEIEGPLSLIKNYRNISNNDRVFRVKDSSKKYLSNKNDPLVPIDIKIELKIGRPLYLEAYLLDNSGIFIRVKSDIVEKAKSIAVKKQDVIDHIGRTGGTDFHINNLEVELDENVGIGFSKLHKVRTLALEKLKEEILLRWTTDKHTNNIPIDLSDIHLNRNSTDISDKQQSNTSIEDAKVLSKTQDNNKNSSYLLSFKDKTENIKIVAIATNADNSRLAKRNGATVYVPVDNYKTQEESFPKNISFLCPAVCHENCKGTQEHKNNVPVLKLLDTLKGDSLLSHNIGVVGDYTFGRYYSSQGYEHNALHETFKEIEAGWHIPITNSYSSVFMAKLGVDTIWLSPEIELSDIKTIINKTKRYCRSHTIKLPKFAYTVIGSQELMVTEHCILMSEGPCNQNCINCERRKSHYYLIDRKGYEFPITTDVLGRSHIYNSFQTDVSHTIELLIHAGITVLAIDTTIMDKEEVAQAFGKLNKNIKCLLKNSKCLIEKTKHTTTGHLFRPIG